MQATCDATNSSVCQNAIDGAMALNATVDMCMIECPLANLTNRPSAMMSPTPTTMTSMMSASVTSTTPTTKDAAEKLCPKFLGVLFIILFTILRQ